MSGRARAWTVAEGRSASAECTATTEHATASCRAVGGTLSLHVPAGAYATLVFGVGARSAALVLPVDLTAQEQCDAVAEITELLEIIREMSTEDTR